MWLCRTRDLLGRPAQDASLGALLQGSYLPYAVVEDPERKTAAVTAHTGEVYSAEVLVVRRSCRALLPAPMRWAPVVQMHCPPRCPHMRQAPVAAMSCRPCAARATVAERMKLRLCTSSLRGRPWRPWFTCSQAGPTIAIVAAKQAGIFYYRMKSRSEAGYRSALDNMPRPAAGLT